MRKGDPPTFVGHSRLRSAKAEARRAPGLRSRSGRFGGVGKEGASADCAEEMKDTTGVSPWRLHWDRTTNPQGRACTLSPPRYLSSCPHNHVAVLGSAKGFPEEVGWPPDHYFTGDYSIMCYFVKLKAACRRNCCRAQTGGRYFLRLWVMRI